MDISELQDKHARIVVAHSALQREAHPDTHRLMIDIGLRNIAEIEAELKRLAHWFNDQRECVDSRESVRAYDSI